MRLADRSSEVNEVFFICAPWLDRPVMDSERGVAFVAHYADSGYLPGGVRCELPNLGSRSISTALPMTICGVSRGNLYKRLT